MTPTYDESDDDNIEEEQEFYIGCAADETSQLLAMTTDLPHPDISGRRILPPDKFGQSANICERANAPHSNTDYRGIGFPGENMSAYKKYRGEPTQNHVPDYGPIAAYCASATDDDDDSPRTTQLTADDNEESTFDRVMDYVAYPEKYLPSFPSMAADRTAVTADRTSSTTTSPRSSAEEGSSPFQKVMDYVAFPEKQLVVLLHFTFHQGPSFFD
jgi:hypothetical protein